MGLSIPVYNHPWDASISVLLVHLSIYRSHSTITQRMRLLRHCRYMYWSISLALQSSKGCFYFCTAVYHHPRAASASIGLSVSVWPLGMVDLPHTVYNHLREVFFPKPPVKFSVCKIRSTIIQGIAPFLSAPSKEQVLQVFLVKLSLYQIYSLFLPHLCIRSIINLEMCSFCAAMQVGLLDTFYNHLRDEFLLHRLCNFGSKEYGLQSSKG